METLQPVQEQKANRVINILSLAIPIAVAVLLSIRQKVDLGNWTTYLPHINGVLNAVTSGLLLLGLYFIRQKNIAAHRRTMLTAFALGSVFLVNYVLYHFSNESTPFGGQAGLDPFIIFCWCRTLHYR